VCGVVVAVVVVCNERGCFGLDGVVERAHQPYYASPPLILG
jgi:hypothetical protein